MNRERVPLKEYERLAGSFLPSEAAPRQLVKLAAASGMRYAVLTAKHHDGFCLWDTRIHQYNSAALGPRRDLVREFTEACREFGVKAGLYYSLLDWRHPDGEKCGKDPVARGRFLDFTRRGVRELCSNYGPVDILWYDMPLPLDSAEKWESVRMNMMVRELQPDIIINHRCHLDEDFSTSENKISPSDKGRDWEACMVLNGVFGWQPTPAEDWAPARSIIEMLRKCASRVNEK
jgi:alpha-L-fucosidase